MTRRRLLVVAIVLTLAGGAYALYRSGVFTRTEPGPVARPPLAARGTVFDPETERMWQRAGFKLDNPSSTTDRTMPGLRAVADDRWREFDIPNPAMPAALVPFHLDLSFTHVTVAVLKRLTAWQGLDSLYLLNCGLTDECLEQLAQLPHLDSLALSLGDATEDGIKHLAGCKNLTGLTIRDSRLTDAAVKHLLGCSRLDHLSLCNCKVTDQALEHVAKMTNLTSLDLSYTEITDEGLKHVAGLKNLTRLHLARTRVTDAGMEYLAELKNLAYLSVDGARVLGTGLRHFAGRKDLRIQYTSTRHDLFDAHLEALAGVGMLHLLPDAKTADHNRATRDEDIVRLDLSDAKRVTDAGLKHLAGLQGLSDLHLNKTSVTGAGFGHLAGLRRLTNLYLYRAPITVEGLKWLAVLKHLRTVGIGGYPRLVNDADLQTLAEIGLLHTLSDAKGPNGERPTGPDDVVSFDMSHTDVTDEGLKHLTVFKNLKSVSRGGRVTDEGLRELRKVLPNCEVVTP